MPANLTLWQTPYDPCPSSPAFVKGTIFRNMIPTNVMAVVPHAKSAKYPLVSPGNMSDASIGRSTVALALKAGMRPCVGLMVATPQQCAGQRSDPPMSLPCAIVPMPAAIDAAAPPDDPPQVISSLATPRHRVFGSCKLRSQFVSSCFGVLLTISIKAETVHGNVRDAVKTVGLGATATTKPRNNFRSALVNAVHHRNLCRLFRVVLLINAYRVDPQASMSVCAQVS